MNKRAERAGVVLKIGRDKLMSVVEDVKRHYLSEYGVVYPDRAIVAAFERWLDGEVERLSEDMAQTLTTPSRSEARLFRRYLEESVSRAARAHPIEAHQVAIEEVGETAGGDVFDGNRVFSFEKLAAMVAYIAAHARDVYKTKLNKLLFYADFVNYYLNATSISGARYIHLPHGPVPDRYESILTTLRSIGTIDIEEGAGYEIVRAAGDDPITAVLSQKEKAAIDWVIENYGKMSASKLSDLSHEEKAYRFTRTGEPIAYEYAKFFNRLPNIIPGD